MLSTTMISNYQAQSLANVRQAATLTFNVMHQLNGLSIRTLQAGTGVSLRRAFVPVEGDFDYSAVDEMRGLFHESLHLTSAWLIDLVKVAESQWAISHRCAHAAVRHLHRWSPRELETAVSALDLALDAAEYATENLADAGVLVVKRLEDEGELFCAAQATEGAQAHAGAAH
ncbi:MAG: hypothetical protein EYC67_04850 [Betaproteobacteria bacterium]|nr:MAG: hypothetical protein EYC67_04850 [Betaproteobacteria bacterium]